MARLTSFAACGLRHHNIEMHPEAGSAYVIVARCNQKAFPGRNSGLRTGIHALGRTQDSQLQTCVSLARALL